MGNEIIVEFTTRFTKWQPGEQARFNPVKAAELVELGVGKALGPPPAPPPMEVEKSEVLGKPKVAVRMLRKVGGLNVGQKAQYAPSVAEAMAADGTAEILHMIQPTLTKRDEDEPQEPNGTGQTKPATVVDRQARPVRRPRRKKVGRKPASHGD